MLISEKRKFIFIHIYKNAGSSITRALIPFAASKWQRMLSIIMKQFNIQLKYDSRPFHAHISALDAISLIGQEKYNSLFSFAIVRNPWDWQVSIYNYMINSSSHKKHDFAKSFGNFGEYLKWRCAKEVRYQKDFICSKDDEILVDFVGRFERIDEDFKKICSRIGISASLGKHNVFNTTPYQEYYNNETIELVRRTFEQDINLFGYEF